MGKGKTAPGKKGASSGQGRGGSKLGKAAGGSSQVKSPMQKKTKTTTSGSPGGQGYSPKDAFKKVGSTRTGYEESGNQGAK